MQEQKTQQSKQIVVPTAGVRQVTQKLDSRDHITIGGADVIEDKANSTTYANSVSLKSGNQQRKIASRQAQEETRYEAISVQK